VATREALERRSEAVFAFVRKGLKITIADDYPLADVAEAHDLITSRRSIGKVLLRP